MKFEFAKQTQETETEIIFEGFTLDGSLSVEKDLPEGFKEIDEWADCFRRVWVNEAAQTMITYVEGDISVVVYKTKEAYQKAFDRAAKFYEEY